MKLKNILIWLSRIIASSILFQTLIFKFTAHPDSIIIFFTLHVEPWGRILLGIIELIVAIVLLIPHISIYGAIISVGLMIGAISTHLLVIGTNFNHDGGTLFILALVVFIASSFNIYLNKNSIQKKFLNIK